ncbi:MAG TPA: alpha-amylase family glycosyl hydrolase [Acidimicrobiia bacterium]|nr:alpha-amylase family glycosyl hydrolase [Acidimicrobiia bacterium]
MPNEPTDIDVPWWMSGVLYQIYPLSFADSNADGYGDLRGILDRLEYLEWLGVDAIWLSPITVSPNADWGYDVADYCAVQPEMGTLAAFDELVAAAHQRGIRVVLDFVPNHTSELHPWFVDSRSSKTARRRDWYLWADGASEGSPPNNWVSSFGGPAWTFDAATDQYYMHNHLSEQPDLNWWNEEVRDAFDDILRFWFDRGVDGFRIDVCNIIVKDAELRDNPPATADDPFDAQMFGQRPVFNMNRPELHDVLRRWRRIADLYDPPRLLLGETPVDDAATLAAFYGTDLDELQLAFNFPFINAPLEATAMREVVERTQSFLPPGAWPAWTGSNHDMSRFATRWASDDPGRARAALVMLAGLRGTPVLYQGDEIGLRDVTIDQPDLRDPLGVKYWPAYAGRDAMRTPMPWNDTPGGGFTDPDVRPWLPMGPTDRNVESQRADPGSMLHLARDLVALRRRTRDLCVGSYAPLPAPPDVWAWRRGDQHAVVVNYSDADVAVADVDGRVIIATDRARDGELIRGSLRLRAWEGAVIELDPTV